jgi:hypothetical protein
MKDPKTSSRLPYWEAVEITLLYHLTTNNKPDPAL